MVLSRPHNDPSECRRGVVVSEPQNTALTSTSPTRLLRRSETSVGSLRPDLVLLSCILVAIGALVYKKKTQ